MEEVEAMDLMEVSSDGAHSEGIGAEAEEIAAAAAEAAAVASAASGSGDLPTTTAAVTPFTAIPAAAAAAAAVATSPLSSTPKHIASAVHSSAVGDGDTSLEHIEPSPRYLKEK